MSLRSTVMCVVMNLETFRLFILFTSETGFTARMRMSTRNSLVCSLKKKNSITQVRSSDCFLRDHLAFHHWVRTVNTETNV